MSLFFINPDSKFTPDSKLKDVLPTFYDISDMFRFGEPRKNIPELNENVRELVEGWDKLTEHCKPTYDIQSIDETISCMDLTVRAFSKIFVSCYVYSNQFTTLVRDLSDYIRQYTKYNLDDAPSSVKNMECWFLHHNGQEVACVDLWVKSSMWSKTVNTHARKCFYDDDFDDVDFLDEDFKRSEDDFEKVCPHIIHYHCEGIEHYSFWRIRNTFSDEIVITYAERFLQMAIDNRYIVEPMVLWLHSRMSESDFKKLLSKRYSGSYCDYKHENYSQTYTHLILTTPENSIPFMKFIRDLTCIDFKAIYTKCGSGCSDGDAIETTLGEEINDVVKWCISGTNEKFWLDFLNESNNIQDSCC